MRKRRIYLGVLLLAVAVVAGFIVAGAFREREPEYGGKRLSEWVLVLGMHHWETDGGQAAVQEAEDAIRHTGTNALPFLLDWIRYETPPWKAKFHGAANRILTRLKPSWHLTNDDDKEVRLARGASQALIALGRQAEGAIGELTQLVNRPRGKASAGRAAISLGGLGHPVGAETPFLVDAILNEMYAITIDRPRTNRHVVWKLSFNPNRGTNALGQIDPQALERGTP